MKMKKTTMLLVVSLLMPCISTAAPLPTDPLGGKPPAGSKPSVKDLDYQVKYQRAFEAVVWSVPAVAIYGFTRGAMGIGTDNNTILAFSKPATPYAELLTANNVTPYMFSQTDLRQGPVVVEVPAANDKASVYGQIVDHWQLAIAGVGPSGVDKGKGGKILLTPPGYKGEVPAGYMHLQSPSYRVNFVFRSIKGPDGTTADAAAYSRTVKMYYLDNPAPTRFIDPSDMRLSTLPYYDEGWFDDVHAIFSVEPPG
jgi:hypothetical protein